MLLKGFLYISDKKFTASLKAKLTFVNPDYEKKIKHGVKLGDTPPLLRLYRKIETKDGIVYQVPRYAFGDVTRINNLKMDLGENIAELQYKDKIIKVDGTELTLNDAQIETITNTVIQLEHKLGAVIVAKPGEGKTVMALHIVAILKQKTLILAHKNALLEQWRENIETVLGIKKDDIGLLQQGKFKDGKIVLGSTQSLMRATIDNKVNKLFGLVIQDEVHRIGAREFLKSFSRFNSKYRLGLSATPNREDELEKLYFLHTSDNLIFHKTTRNVTADYKFTEYVRESKWRYYPAYIPYKIGLIHNIVADDDRNELIVELIVNAYKKERSILVLSERIKHLKGLMELTKGKLNKSVKIVRFFGAETITKKQRKEGIKQERVEDPKLSELQSADIIFATYRKAMEGIDVPHLDTLLFATPLSSKVTIEQAVGRIEREFKNKRSPLVIDIYDFGNNLLEGMAKKRLKIYERLCSK